MDPGHILYVGNAYGYMYMDTHAPTDDANKDVTVSVSGATALPLLIPPSHSLESIQLGAKYDMRTVPAGLPYTWSSATCNRLLLCATCTVTYRPMTGGLISMVITAPVELGFVVMYTTLLKGI